MTSSGKITGLELLPVSTTREMGRTGPADPEPAVSHHVVVKLQTDMGIVGLGEMSDIDFARDPGLVAALQKRLEPLLAGGDLFSLTAIQNALQAHEWDHQVLCGIDIALHDAVAKALDVPLYVLFGGKLRDRIRFSYPLAPCQTEADVDANLARIQNRLDQGHDCFRYYFGAELDLDERFLDQLRRRWDRSVEINALDASGRFAVGEAIAAIKRLAPYGTNLVESPVKGRHDAPVEDFIAVKEAVDVPIGEHIASDQVAARLARHQAVDVWNVGIGYAGITAARKLFHTAAVCGVEVLHGSTVEMSIGTAARAHLMASIPELALPCYPSGPLVHHEDIARERVRYEEGHIVVPEGPGLGIELDEDKLAAQRIA